jgi:hypothetical protein
VRNRPYGFEIYLVNVKTEQIAQIFVAFSEKLNFNCKHILSIAQFLIFRGFRGACLWQKNTQKNLKASHKKTKKKL